MGPDPQKTGLFLVGVRGAISTTVLHGIEALRSGVPPTGMVTAAPALADLPWAEVERFVVQGWDVAGDCNRAAADLVRTGVLPQDLVEMTGPMRDRLELSVAPGVPEPEDGQLVDPM